MSNGFDLPDFSKSQTLILSASISSSAPLFSLDHERINGCVP